MRGMPALVPAAWAVIAPTFLLWTLLSSVTHARADEVQDEIRALKRRIEELERRVAEQDGKMQTQENKIAAHNTVIEEIRPIKDAVGNLEFSLGATSVVQGTIHNDRNQ